MAVKLTRLISVADFVPYQEDNLSFDRIRPIPPWEGSKICIAIESWLCHITSHHQIFPTSALSV